MSYFSELNLFFFFFCGQFFCTAACVKTTLNTNALKSLVYFAKFKRGVVENMFMYVKARHLKNYFGINT